MGRVGALISMAGCIFWGFARSSCYSPYSLRICLSSHWRHISWGSISFRIFLESQTSRRGASSGPWQTWFWLTYRWLILSLFFQFARWTYSLRGVDTWLQHSKAQIASHRNSIDLGSWWMRYALSYIGIWSHSKYASIKPSSSCPAVVSIVWSILSRRKLSFGQVLLMLVKSMHTLEFSLFFFMKFGLAIHLGYLASCINPLWSSFCTSLLSISYFSRFRGRRFCCFSRIKGSMYNLWLVTSGSIHFMSSCLRQRRRDSVGWTPLSHPESVAIAHVLFWVLLTSWLYKLVFYLTFPRVLPLQFSYMGRVSWG